MSIFSAYKTDPVLEQEGILIESKSFRARFRRSGGANKRFIACVQKALKPWRNKDLDKEDPEVRIELYRKVFIEACYVEYSWESKVGNEWVRGIENESGEIVPGTIGNVTAVLLLLPDLCSKLEAEASELDNFLAAETKKATENL